MPGIETLHITLSGIVHVVRYPATAKNEGVYGEGCTFFPVLLTFEGINDELEVGRLALTSTVQPDVSIEYHNVSKKNLAFKNRKKLQLSIHHSAPEHGMTQTVVQRHIVKCYSIEEP